MAVVVVSIGFVHGVGAREGFEDLLKGDASNDDINGYMTWKRSAENRDIEAAELIKEVREAHAPRVDRYWYQPSQTRLWS